MPFPPTPTAKSFGTDVIVGAVVGVLAGLGSWIFLGSLTWATSTRIANGWLVVLLPFAGLVVGVLTKKFRGPTTQGMNLVLDDMVNPVEGKPGPPITMTGYALIGATLTHLFGGSGGREGAAVQIAAGMTAPLTRFALFDRRRLAIASAAGGFGAVFGVPFAGALFGVEVPVAWRLQVRNLLLTTVASFVGHATAQALGVHHAVYPPIELSGSAFRWVAGVAMVSAACGACALAFIEAKHFVTRTLQARIANPIIHPMVGGVVLLGLAFAFRTRDYLGLSLPLIDTALLTGSLASAAFAIKLLFTVITLGSGFPGGEVTPLMCVGACVGASIAHLLGLPAPAMAMIGFAAVFGGASHTPLACTVLAVEVFGPGIAIPAAIACFGASAICGRRSVYGHQRVVTSDDSFITMHDAEVARKLPLAPEV